VRFTVGCIFPTARICTSTCSSGFVHACGLMPKARARCLHTCREIGTGDGCAEIVGGDGCAEIVGAEIVDVHNAFLCSILVLSFWPWDVGYSSMLRARLRVFCPVQWAMMGQSSPFVGRRFRSCAPERPSPGAIQTTQAVKKVSAEFREIVGGMALFPSATARRA